LTLRVAGAAVREKLGVAPTVRAIVVLWLKLPETPVTVTVEDPATALLAAVNVSVLLPVALAGLKAAVTPPGNPETVRFTALLNPFCAAMAMVLVPLPL
jgi:hypothetical protein